MKMKNPCEKCYNFREEPEEGPPSCNHPEIKGAPWYLETMREPGGWCGPEGRHFSLNVADKY